MQNRCVEGVSLPREEKIPLGESSHRPCLQLSKGHHLSSEGSAWRKTTGSSGSANKPRGRFFKRQEALEASTRQRCEKKARERSRRQAVPGAQHIWAGISSLSSAAGRGEGVAIFSSSASQGWRAEQQLLHSGPFSCQIFFHAKELHSRLRLGNHRPFEDGDDKVSKQVEILLIHQKQKEGSREENFRGRVPLTRQVRLLSTGREIKLGQLQASFWEVL